MAFEEEFSRRFDSSTEKALKVGMKGAFIEGCNVGIANGLIYFAEALLFWVGAVLISREIYTYLQMVVVLQLVVFSVSIAGQMLAFSKRCATSLHLQLTPNSSWRYFQGTSSCPPCTRSSDVAARRRRSPRRFST